MIKIIPPPAANPVCKALCRVLVGVSSALHVLQSFISVQHGCGSDLAGLQTATNAHRRWRPAEMGTHCSGMPYGVSEVWAARSWSRAAVLQRGYGTAVSPCQGYLILGK